MSQDEMDEIGGTRLPMDAPADVAAALRALDFSGGYSERGRRNELLTTETGDEFLAEHADHLAEIAAAAEIHQRRFLALLCAVRDAERYAGLLAALAVDEDCDVRAEALAGLSWVDGPRQVELLRAHLRTAAPDRLIGVLRRLADVADGIAAVEDALTASEGQPLGVERATLLRRTADRASRISGPDTSVPIPPTKLPTETDVIAELDAVVAAARQAGERFRPGVGSWLERIPDVRAVRDALRQAGMVDADRRVAAILTTPDGRGKKPGSVLTPEDAGRWWPLFAERLDLVDEYLDGIDFRRGDDDDVVDTTDMMLRILEGFPAAPNVLLARLTSIALGASRHRLAARRVLRDRPEVRVAARAMLDGTDATTRASAAEWLAGLGEPGVVAPEPGWEFGEGVLAPAVRALPAATLWWLDRFQERALAEGVPAPEVNRWLGLASPVLRTGRPRAARSGDGPVMGRLGGPLMLPPDVPTPAYVFVYEAPSTDADREEQYQLIVTIDLAAVPAGATDLRLPPDGRLLLFANLSWEPVLIGGAVYIPAGTAVEERKSSFTHEIPGYRGPEALDEELRRDADLRLVPGVSLPSAFPDDETIARHPHAETLSALWHDLTRDDAYGHDEWQIGGYAADFDGYGDPVRSSWEYTAQSTAADDWVMLAQWTGVPDGNLCWAITRQDLAALRFDRVLPRMQANP